MPGAREVERQNLREVDTEEAGQVGPVVLDGSPEKRLCKEHQRDDKEEPGSGGLRRGHLHLARLPE